MTVAESYTAMAASGWVALSLSRLWNRSADVSYNEARWRSAIAAREWMRDE